MGVWAMAGWRGRAGGWVVGWLGGAASVRHQHSDNVQAPGSACSSIAPPHLPRPNHPPARQPLPPACSHTIKTFGALLFATVMTTRQFISILLSCLLFAHPLTAGQWLGTVMVFGERRGAAALGENRGTVACTTALLGLKSRAPAAGWG